jgi:hypothetical protein
LAKNNPEQDSKSGGGRLFGDKVSWAVFLPTIAIVFLSIISLVFPALIIRATSPMQSDVLGSNIINPYEPGALAAPLITINLIILGIGFAYYKRSKFSGIVNKISGFEISRKQAIIAVIILLAIFASVTAGTLAKEETWEDYPRVKERVHSWTISDFGKSFEPHVRYLLLSASVHIFGNIRVIPFVTSAALLLLVYFFTKNITQKRFAGVVSMALLLQSRVFVDYSTTASYDNAWILLYLFGLFLIQKFWPPSPVSFIMSILSKALTVAFLPMTLFFIARSSLSKRSKIYSLISYGVIGLVLVAASSALKSSTGGVSSYASDFWQGFASMALQMRFDYIITIFLLPVVVLLFFASRKKILHADSVMICITSILFASPLLALTTQTNQPYRFVSLVVFFAIGVGVLLSNRTRKQVEVSSSKQ